MDPIKNCHFHSRYVYLIHAEYVEQGCVVLQIDLESEKRKAQKQRREECGQNQPRIACTSPK